MSEVVDYDDTWDYDPYDDPSDNEPACWGCWFSESGTCTTCQPLRGREHRREARHSRRWRQRQRKVDRHANDRFWQARNRPAFDDDAPF